jgi:hypothetical protein
MLNEVKHLNELNSDFNEILHFVQHDNAIQGSFVNKISSKLYLTRKYYQAGAYATIFNQVELAFTLFYLRICFD